MKTLTLAYLLKDKKICLGYKKRGFGEGNWNGFGGKLEEGETAPQAAVREIKEEIEVIVNEKDLEQVLDVEFYFKDGLHLKVPTYFVYTWLCEPRETAEMRPHWFAHEDIPYEKMWSDDIHWMPRVLAGERLVGKVWFDGSGKEIAKMEWKSVSSFSLQ